VLNLQRLTFYVQVIAFYIYTKYRQSICIWELCTLFNSHEITSELFYSMNHTNKLIHETSPYLLQHAHNPVNWLPFGDDAFEEAQRRNKPLLISIGYSSCHWCHVMEHESFENEEIASLMNDNFVCVKVDREERPDVDHVYMDAVQQIHGSGGWPLNCFALPDGRPFWGGTYFRPEQWTQLISNIGGLFHKRFADLERQATELSEGVARQNYLLNDEPVNNIGKIDFAAIYEVLRKAFDSEKGGMSGSPKFPMPVVLNFLLQYSIIQKDDSASILLDLTLQKMACGGIYDQAGGGFARYSTDSDWKVPHFEKMLYDNAQLISLYSAAFQHTGKRLYKEVIEQTIEFISRELKSPEGIFYSALDADSEGEEGLFYTWTTNEFNEVLGHYSALGGEYYGIDAKGLWENGRNILLRPDSDDLFAQQHFLSAGELASLTGFCRAQLLKARSERIRPGLDDKMLVAWNSLMISALTDAYIALDRIDFLDSAVTTASFILKNLKRPDNGLFHTWKNGKSQINAFLDDYAFTCYAFIKLYSVTTDEHWLHEAESLANYVVQHFFDSHSGFFWYSENDDKQVFARKIEIYDGVIASGNSAMADVLNTLGIFLHNTGFTEKAGQMLSSMENRFTRYPSAYANWASLSISVANEQYVIAVVGSEAVPVIKKLKEQSLADTHIFGSRTCSNLPYFENRYVEGKTLIYICSGSYCMAPVESVEEAVALIVNSE
jgi:uncharacterized protein YyaL (SSP411 family)